MYTNSLKASKEAIYKRLRQNQIAYEVEEIVLFDNYSIDKIIIDCEEYTINRLILSSGLHGIEGYVGQIMIEHFINDIVKKLKHTEVIIYHPINPYGLHNDRRTNENNVDLNRNFSMNNFKNNNRYYQRSVKYFMPKRYNSILWANIRFYFSTLSMILKNGIKGFKAAILNGQTYLDQGIYYQGTTFEDSTLIIKQEIDLLNDDKIPFVWVDLHTGYGHKYQMSIVNSMFEKRSRADLISMIDYFNILNMDENEFYLIDGDITDYIYKNTSPKINIYSTCFEFGTLGTGTMNELKSLKAMIFENSAYHGHCSKEFTEYSHKLLTDLYQPLENEWIDKARTDFDRAIKGIIKSML